MFAVLQTSLSQPISREALEAAVMATRSLAKPDCAVLQRELFGIIAGNLDNDEALGMQAQFRAHGVETEVVDESALPKLPAPKRAQAFHISPEGLRVVEYAGRAEVFNNETLAFAAAGRVLHLKNQPFQRLEWTQHYMPGGHIRQEVEAVTDHRLEDIPEFRLEFYVMREPYRWQWILDERSVLRANEKIIKLRDRSQLDELSQTLAKSLPAGRVNLGIQNAGIAPDFRYPSVRAFEEEIVWSFYRLAK